MDTLTGKHARWRLFGVLALAAALRLPGLGQVPPPLNQDEASRGYDAWCLLETGADRHGRRLPFFLESFGPGDNTAALSTYLTIPFVAVLGPTPAAMRLPDALLGVATAGLLYLWLRRRFGDVAGLIGAAALAADPWHVALSRTAHEAGFTPFLLVLGLLAADRAGLLPDGQRGAAHAGAGRALDSPIPGEPPGSRSRAAWAFVAGLMLALHAWAYPAARLFTPLLILAIVLVYSRACLQGRRSEAQRGACGANRTRSNGVGCRAVNRTGYKPVPRVSGGALAAAAAGLVLGACPLWITAIREPGRLASRARATLIRHERPEDPSMPAQFAKNYAAHLDPRYAFLRADEMSGASIPGVGLHLPVLAPLWLIGLARLAAGTRRRRFDRLLIAWLLLYPVPAAVCRDWNPHPLRSVAGVALFPVVVAAGASWSLDRLAAPRRRRAAAGVAALALLLNAVFFADAYFRRFPGVAADAYQAALFRTFQYVARKQRGAPFVLVTNEANQPYIYALLAEPIPPAALRASPPVICPGPKGFHQVLRAGRYLFVPLDPQGFPEAGVRFRALLAGLPPNVEGLVIEGEPPGEAGAAAPDVVYRTSDGSGDGTAGRRRNYRVRRWRPSGVRSASRPAGGG